MKEASLRLSGVPIILDTDWMECRLALWRRLRLREMFVFVYTDCQFDFSMSDRPIRGVNNFEPWERLRKVIKRDEIIIIIERTDTV